MRGVAQCATTPAGARPMSPIKPGSPQPMGSDLPRVDAHVIQPGEYEELPELTDEMHVRAVFKKAGRPQVADANGQAPEDDAAAACGI